MAIRAAIADQGGQFALDANALASLKAQAKTAPDAALGKAAGQFEALFLQLLMKQMREALPQDGPLTSDTTRTYTAMFDQQLAQQLSNQGVGLKKIIEKQLARHLGAPDPNGAAPAGASTPAAPAPSTQKSTAAPLTSLPAGVQAFIDKLRPHAEAAAKSIGIPTEYLLAQAGLETGWGKSMPRNGDGSTSHNLFGVKAGSTWHGQAAVASTTEWVGGQLTRVADRFRAYGSVGDALQDFAKLLRDNPRYQGALANSHDPRAYANSLQRAGYATDPHYADKLTRAIATVSRHVGSTTRAVLQVSAGSADNKTSAG